MKLKWYFKNGTKYELYSVLYDDDVFLLVQNDNTQKISFGMKRDFGTLCGFPVSWSCLSVKDAIRILNDLIKVDERYINELGDIAAQSIQRWQGMIKSVQNKGDKFCVTY